MKQGQIQPPKIPGSNEKEKEFHCFSISKTERQVIFKKYINQGLTKEEAENKVKKIQENLEKIKQKLKKSKKPTEEKLNKLKEELSKYYE